METSKQPETESENDREVSSCGSPVQNASENDKDAGDMDLGSGEQDEDSNTPPATSSSTTKPNNVVTFHGSRSASHIGRKPAFGQTCSMKTLVQDGILQPGERVLTLEHGDTRCYGDLRKDGTISMRDIDGSSHVYATPVAWANYCYHLINPEMKPLNAWSSIRFKGKRLDSYKLKWYRAQKKPNMMNNSNNTNNVGGACNMNLQNNAATVLMVHNPNYFPQYENPLKNKKLIRSVLISNNMDNECRRLVAKSLDSAADPDPCTTVINYEQLGTRGPHNTHNPNTMVKCIPFSAVDRIQPFNVTVSTNALLLVDFHSHLVAGEVAGYLAGSWDGNQHTLTVTQAFPCKTVLDDESSAVATEDEIRQDIEKRNLTVVGWYHSHQGKYSNHPTIKDIQNQMEHQIIMKESNGVYTPCVGLICSPHDTRSDDDLSPSFQIYWVMPPPENFPNHYGRPMQMYFSVTRDLFLTQDLLLEMRLLANYYTSRIADMVDFKADYPHNVRITNLDKLSGSIKPKLPKDLQESEYPDEPAIWKAAVDHFWKFLRHLVIPPSEQSQDQQEEPQTQEENREEEEIVEDEQQKEAVEEKLEQLGVNEAVEDLPEV